MVLLAPAPKSTSCDMFFQIHAGSLHLLYTLRNVALRSDPCHTSVTPNATRHMYAYVMRGVGGGKGGGPRGHLGLHDVRMSCPVVDNASRRRPAE